MSLIEISIENDEDCIICFECMKKKYNTRECCNEEYKKSHIKKIINCTHYFHNDCIEQWILKHNTCPICRTVIDENRKIYEENNRDEYTEYTEYAEYTNYFENFQELIGSEVRITLNGMILSWNVYDYPGISEEENTNDSEEENTNESEESEYNNTEESDEENAEIDYAD